MTPRRVCPHLPPAIYIFLVAFAFSNTLFLRRIPSEGVSLRVCVRESVMYLIPSRPCVYEPTYTSVFFGALDFLRQI